MASAATLVALTTAIPAQPEAAGLRLKAFDSCTELRDYRGEHRGALAASIPFSDAQFSPPIPSTGIGGERHKSEGAPGTAPGAGQAPTPDFSPTNVQEAGVDEPDLVKTDGARVFVVDGRRLHAIDVGPSGPRLFGSVRLDRSRGEEIGDAAQSMLISGSRALVFGQLPSGNTLLTEVDITDPTAMRVVETLNVEGGLVSARLNGTVARAVITNLAGQRLDLPRAVRKSWLAGKRTERGKLAPCPTIRHPARFSGLDMLTVLTIDLSQGLAPTDRDTVMTSGEIVYGSPESLYVATERWLKPGAEDSRLGRTTTELHKFDLEGASTVYRGSGEVPGYMLSQWSMSERGELLRVASTTDPPFADGRPGRSQSFLTVLAESGGRLVRIGRVGGIGRGEEIRSVRFIDDMGYVVTFRQVDPLHTVDLSVPTAPRVAGELTIRGYSAYLHPIGEDLLLGIGQDVGKAGLDLGTQLSIFHVSNPSAPLRTHQRVIQDSLSEVEFTHLAFLYWQAERLAVLPLEVIGRDLFPTFIGAVGFRVDPQAGIQEIVRITQGPGDIPIARAVVAGGRLYTVSRVGVLANNLQSFAPEGWVRFGP